MYIVVNSDGKYFTNDWRKLDGEYPLLWTSHKRLAKQYQKRGWAINAAKKVGGIEMRLYSRLAYR